MDDRYLYFALSDDDYFDVPWGAGDGTEPLRVPDGLLPGWQVDERGPWRVHRPPDHVGPDVGWKVHVTARPHDARRTLETVARVCAAERAAFKVVRTVGLVQAAHAKYAPASLAGKVCAVYSDDDDHLTRLVAHLGVALAGRPGPRIQGDLAHPSAPLGLRFGAYREHWVEAPDGRTVPGMRADDGPAPDDRSVLPGRMLPDDVARLLASAHREHPLPVSGVTLVHRSNAGSLYRAVLDDGRAVALKEARHHTGLTAQGVDAVARLRHEEAVLQRLSGHGIAPEPVDYWELVSSDILVMEWVDGGSLVARLGRTHPAGRPGASEHEVRRYHAWAEAVADELADLVARLHDLGLTHGDLHPGNVVLGPDGLRLVDLECASIDGHVATREMGTPGYALADADPFRRDRFALDRTRAALHDPDVSLLDRRPDLRPRLQPTDSSTAEPGVPDVPPDAALLDRLVDDLLARASPERSDRLFAGGIEQFTSPLGGHDLLSGAAGVLLALQAAGRPPDPDHLDWLAAVPGGRRPGLATGVDGVALALALLGRHEEAATLVEAPDVARHLGWASGRAGQAVALVELGRCLGRADLHDLGLTVADDVARAAADPAVTLSRPGLLDGWAGVALALLRVAELAELDADPCRASSLRVAAATALRRELEVLTPMGECLVATPAGRVRAGLGHGSGAFALAVAALGVHDASDALLDDAGARAARACRQVVPVAGLFDGLAGHAAVLRAWGRHPDAEVLEHRAGWHCVPTRRGWSALGAQRLRCSDDVQTGSAGLVAALGPGGTTRLGHVLRLPRTGHDTCHVPSLPTATAEASRTDV
ncbi:hypothetical protein ABFT23_11080 [Nocardioides sp. C4-1]|uniref:class III lanthionine synthetase LanKC N-terminal domain-containing protein n=1 Tax=Nocardioides sp. C4-1 TaxID=3151851 RepID=UPI003267F8D2